MEELDNGKWLQGKFNGISCISPLYFVEKFATDSHISQIFLFSWKLESLENDLLYVV